MPMCFSRNWYSFLIVCFLFATGCEEPKEGEVAVNLEQDLPGVWETASFEVKIKTANNSPKDEVLAVQEGDWKNSMRRKPFLTSFAPDNKYTLEVRNENDSLMERYRGLWNVFGDTLVMIEPTVTYQYAVRKLEEYFLFESLLDWDGDGERDDYYKGYMRKVQ